MEQQESPRWWAVVAVMIGIFLLVTAEQLPIGLLSQVAESMGVTPGMAGLMVTVPGVVAAFSAPLLPVAVGRLDRRIMLTLMMAVMVLGSVLSAMASNFALLLAARVLVGISIGGFWAIAGSIAPRLVPSDQVSRAMTIIFGGVAAASVLGVPLGTLLGDISNWRVAFGALGGLSLLTALALWRWLPPLPPREPVRLRVLAQQLKNRGVRVAVLTTGLGLVRIMLFLMTRVTRSAVLSVSALAVRGAARRPGRSLATVCLLACGCFMVMVVDAFRHRPQEGPQPIESGTGGFALVGESSLPVLHDLNREDGLDALGLNLDELGDISVLPFRVRDGDDASCLNLNRARCTPGTSVSHHERSLACAHEAASHWQTRATRDPACTDRS